MLQPQAQRPVLKRCGATFTLVSFKILCAQHFWNISCLSFLASEVTLGVTERKVSCLPWVEDVEKSVIHYLPTHPKA